MKNSPAFQTINPATGAVLKEYSYGTPAEIDNALDKAANAAKECGRRALSERTSLLHEIAGLIEAEKENFAHLAAEEMGKPITQGITEVKKCARTFRYYAENAARFLENEIVSTEARKSYVAFRPLGVVLAIMPWNFPFWQVLRAAAPILAAGNTLVLKHASNVTGCALAIDSLFRQKELPENLLQTVLVSGSEAGKLITDPRIQAVTFTGSTGVGKQIAATAGGVIKKQVLELGGSDPYLILADADIEKAVAACAKSRLNNCGQSCVAAKRFIVVPEIRTRFEEAFTTAMNAVIPGDPLDKSTALGPMARIDLRDELHEQVKKSVEKGARILCGGTLPEKAGAWYLPTVLADVKPGMPAYEEELFGPVAAIIAAKDEADAIRIANDSAFGLGAGVFTQNRERGEHIAHVELEAGNCFVNEPVHSDPKLPFGGVKESGYGRELSGFGIREFVNIKTVYVN